MLGLALNSEQAVSHYRTGTLTVSPEEDRVEHIIKATAAYCAANFRVQYENFDHAHDVLGMDYPT